MSIADMEFPRSDELKSGFWQPIFFRPNLDTPERLVAGVIAFVEGEWCLQRASALDRLKCLYGDEASVALDVLEYGFEKIEKSLDKFDASEDVDTLVSGIQIGKKVAAQAYAAEELGLRCIRLISSLHSRRREMQLNPQLAVASAPIDQATRDIFRDRLSVLVMEHMAEAAPKTRLMFNSHVRRLEQEQGARLITHTAYVAFTGQKVAANFATLKPGRQKVAVDVSKRLMWDLEQHRESEDSLVPRLSHEMILYHPAENDPTITSKQFENVMNVVQTLKEEGGRRDIKVLPYISVPEISQHILCAEGLRLQ